MRNLILGGAVALVVMVFAPVAKSGEVVVTNTVAFQSLDKNGKDAAIKYLADKTVVLTNGIIVQYRVPIYGQRQYDNGRVRIPVTGRERMGASFGGSGAVWDEKYDMAALTNFGIARLSGKIIQSVGGDLYLIETERIDSIVISAILLPGQSSLVDGTEISTWAKEDGLYEYINTLSAKSRVAKYRKEETIPFSEQALISALQAGATFTIRGEPSQKTETCPKCHGWLKEKMTCQECNRTGKVTTTPLITLTK